MQSIQDRLKNADDSELTNIFSDMVKAIEEQDEREEYKILFEFSAFLHIIPELYNGHEVGMVEVGYNDEGKLEYGPFWLTNKQTDDIVRQFIAYRNK